MDWTIYTNQFKELAKPLVCVANLGLHYQRFKASYQC